MWRPDWKANKQAEMNNREKLYSFITVIMSIVAILIAGELLVRVFVPHSNWMFFEASDDWRLDPEIGWTNRYSYHARSELTDAGKSISFDTNVDGILPQNSARK